MVFVPRDHFLWDFWFAPREPGEPYHLFYLQAPRDLSDPELRHWQAHVGHAVSTDLVHWEERSEAFAPGPEGEWDDRAIWTGSIIKHDGRFFWHYTALCRRDGVQRIGLAISEDLERWERHPVNPLLEADPRWYEKVPTGSDALEAWRDPWVVPDSERGGWVMFVTARANAGPDDERGVIGAARSDDLVHWQALPPVATPKAFEELEVPQSLRLADRWVLLFCTARPSARHRQLDPAGNIWGGTHYLVADDLLGPYQLAPGPPLLADRLATFYAGRIVEGPEGDLVFLARRQHAGEAGEGGFLGGLSNPAPVSVSAHGLRAVDAAALWPSEAKG